MNASLKAKLINLLNVKSIVTLILTLVFSILSLCRVVSAEQFMTVFATVIAFYFGTQHQKNYQELEKDKTDTGNLQ